MKSKLREKMFKIWYWYISMVDKNADILFMNYGYNDTDQKIKLKEQNEANRYSVQLYHHLACEADLDSKNIVEIGCGRGGGLSYITEKFSPATALGIELNKKAVSFCNKYYSLDGLSFLQGDAQNLNLENNSFDVVINVESSHRYPRMSAFLGEVSRILRPGGYFLFTDFRRENEIEDMKKELELCELTVLKERIINKEVIAALELDDERKRQLVKKLTPKFLHKTALNFGGAIGSETYDRFVSNKFVYFSYVLKKH